MTNIEQLIVDIDELQKTLIKTQESHGLEKEPVVYALAKLSNTMEKVTAEICPQIGIGEYDELVSYKRYLTAKETIESRLQAVLPVKE